MENPSGISLVGALALIRQDVVQELSRLLSDSMCFPEENTIQEVFKQHWIQLKEKLGEVAVMTSASREASVKETAERIFIDLDRRWVEAVLGGDEDAWSALLCALKRLVVKVLKVDPSQVEDVLQDAIVRLFLCVRKKSIDSARMTSKGLKAWLIKTARRILIDNFRRNKKVSLAEDLGEGFLEEVSAAIESAEVEFIEGEAKARRAELLDQALQALEKKHPELRAVIELHYSCGWSVEQISKKFTVDQSNLRSKIHRAHIFLRKFMLENNEMVIERTGKDGDPLGRPKGPGKKTTSMKEAQL